MEQMIEALVKTTSTAVEYAQLSGNELVLDLYCGIGTISQFMAQKAKKVYGVEIVPQAIEDAKNNAKLVFNPKFIPFYPKFLEEQVNKLS